MSDSKEVSKSTFDEQKLRKISETVENQGKVGFCESGGVCLRILYFKLG
jgi:hypothetical protein